MERKGGRASASGGAERLDAKAVDADLASARAVAEAQEAADAKLAAAAPGGGARKATARAKAHAKAHAKARVAKKAAAAGVERASSRLEDTREPRVGRELAAKSAQIARLREQILQEVRAHI